MPIAQMACLDETTVTLFLEQRLAEDRAAFVEGHIDGCSPCRRLLSELARGRVAASTGAAGVIDRYVVQRLIGSGGMGTVYAAFDPLLDRTVALKLLHRDRVNTAESRSRLIREAQAMAKVSSPNVIAVFDVGTFADQIYIAMELATGGTLGSWLRERPRPWRDVLRVMIQAGRGLAAAHAAGLVHRDFKPDNVLIDRDRVRVADFGLARTGERRDDDADATGDQAELAGTPAYMAPEQLAGEPANVASDQFSYCVALYEALYGERPFRGSNLGLLSDEVRAGNIRPPSGAVPAWLRAIVVRGLAVEPSSRHRSMDAVVAELDRRRTPVWWLAGGAALAAAGVIAWRLVAPAGDAACEGFERRLDGVWDESRKQALDTAFAATGVAYARETTTELDRVLDRYARAWVDTRVDACRATMRGEQSEHVLDLRMYCLDRRRDELAALVGELGAPDSGAIAKAIYAAHALEPIADCSAAAALAAPIEPPADARIATWNRQLDAARSDLALARFARAETTAAEVVASASTAGVKQTIADALLVEARAVERRGDLPRADLLYRDAALAGEASKLDLIAASARIDRIRVAIDRGKTNDAREMILAATAAAERVGSPPAVARSLATAEGVALAATGDYAAAQLRFRDALAIATRSSTDELELARAHNNVGATFTQLGKPHEAELALASVVEIRRKALGPHHPDVASAEVNLAQALQNEGRFADALPVLEDAAATLRAALGPEHRLVAAAVTELATVQQELGHLDLALTSAREALAIDERRAAPAREIALIHNNIADILDSLGRRDDALAEYRIALELRDKELGPDHPDVAQSLNNMANTLVALARYPEALAAFERALAIKTKVLGVDHVRLAPSLVGIGQVKLETHDPAGALAPLERACKLFEGEGDPVDLAICRFSLARALWDANRDRKRAVELARTAHAVLVTGGTSAKSDLEHAERWLATHH